MQPCAPTRSCRARSGERARCNDFALAISITFSVLILMTALFIQAPLEFSAFPTVLLIAIQRAEAS
jgi:hypothetical protein